ncbi:O-antigen ligase family protein [bacterium]|nr:O-antigen ligase family protein [bacterium]
MDDKTRIPRFDENEAPPPAPSTVAPRPTRESLERPDLVLEDARKRDRRARPIEAKLERPELSLSLMLRKFAEVGVMASFLAAVLSYPLFLPPRINLWLLSAPSGDGFAQMVHRGITAISLAFRPAITGELPVLELKSAAWLLTGLLVIAAWGAARLAEWLLRIDVLARHPSQPLRRGMHWLRFLPLAAGGGFLLWTLISILPIVGWAPELPAESVLANIPQIPDKTWTGFGGAYNSVIAWLQVAAGVALFFVIQNLIRTRRYAFKLTGLILGLGVMAATTSILLHVDFPILSDIWIRWAPGEFRNDMGGFIGHNVALSAFMIAPMLMSWTLLLVYRGRYSKGVAAGLIAGIAVMALAVLLAQSRGVIPILGVAFIALIVLLWRQAAVRPGMAFYILVPVGLLLLLLTQTINQEWNPLYRRNIPLSTRIEHISVEHLKTETRLRILVASLPVVAKHPILGTGWGTFQYVYPQAQGEYYQAHPDTDIAPTPKRTQRAHDEYLQTLFESGVVGLGLALTAVISILLLGWRLMGRSLGQRNIAIQISIVVSLIALLAHGLVDFPFRVAPIASTVVILLAIWGVSDRLWLIRIPEMSEREIENDKQTLGVGPLSIESAPKLDSVPDPGPRKRMRIAAIAWLVSVFVLGGLFVIAGTKVGDWLSSETYLIQSQQKYAKARIPGENEPALLRLAWRDVQNSLALMPHNGGSMLEAAKQLHASASSGLQHAARMRNEGKTQEAEQEFRGAVSDANLGLSYLDKSLGEIRFHFSYSLRAGLHHYLFYFTSGNKAEQLGQTIRYYSKAVEMNPGDGDSIVRLLSILESSSGDRLSDQKVREEEVANLRKLLMRWHPGLFQDNVIAKVDDMRSIFAFKTAHELSGELLKLDPRDPRLILARTLTAYEVQDMDTIEKYTTQLARDMPETGGAAQARIAIREGQIDRAYRLMRGTIGKVETLGVPTQVLYDLIRLHVDFGEDNESEHKAAEDNLAQLVKDEPNNLTWVANFLLFDFDQPLDARDALERRLAIPEPEIQPQTRLLMAMTLIAQHRDRLGELPEKLEDVREVPSPVTDVGTRQDLQQALQILTHTRNDFSSREQRIVMDARIAQVRNWLGLKDEQ